MLYTEQRIIMKKPSLVIIIAIYLLSSSILWTENLYISKNIGIVSNYVYRGMTQSDEKPSIQANIYLLKNNLYGGVFIS